MSSNVPIAPSGNLTAPTPQNTPLQNAPITSGLSRPTVPDITEDNEEEVGGGEPELQSAMLGLVQNRLSTLLGKSSGYIESLPNEVKRSVEALKGVQVKQNELFHQYKRECLDLEQKYLELARPLYERRHVIITGAAEPTAEEVAEGEKESAKDDDEYTPLPKDISGPSAIPEFWLTALRNHVGISDLITDRDAGALKHLKDIRLAYLEKGKPAFKIDFVFESNEYFENEVLTKTYTFQDELGYAGDFVYDKAIGTEIKWKDDKDLTKEFEIKKQRNKNTNRTRLVRKARPTESFFNFFNPPVPPAEDALESGEIDEDEMEEIEEKLEVDYQIGEDLREKVIPRAIDYFTGKALEFDLVDDDDDDAFEDLEDDDEDEDQFDDDDDSDEEPVPRRRGPPKGRGGAPAGSGNVNPEECKQQ